MKEFMMIFIGADYGDAGLSPEQMQQRMGLWMSWIDNLKNENLYVTGNPLLPEAKRVSGNEQVITDGPFVESNELIGGYFIYKANDMDHALALTDGYPDFDLGGSVEVREIMTM
jgi:hypothetical protein